MTARAKTARSRNDAQRGQSLRVQRLVRRFKTCRHPKSNLIDGPREEMRWGTGPTQYCTACGASRNMLHCPGPWRAPNFDDLAALEESKPELMAKIRAILLPNAQLTSDGEKKG